MLLVYEKPVGLYVTLAAAHVVSRQGMVAVLGLQILAVGQAFHHSQQLFGVLSLLFGQLEVLLELPRKPDLVLYSSKASRRASILR